MKDYIQQAMQTLSPQWHGELVGQEYLHDLFQRAIGVANEMDAVKKALFYGRIPESTSLLAFGDKPSTEQFLCDRLGDGNADPKNIVHAIIGQFTESGELLEALHEALFGKCDGIDPINLREEIGDSLWYQAILLNGCARDGDGYTFEDAMRINIAKLRKRFPDKFTEYDANNRDLDSERKILSGE